MFRETETETESTTLPEANPISIWSNVWSERAPRNLCETEQFFDRTRLYHLSVQ